MTQTQKTLQACSTFDPEDPTTILEQSWRKIQKMQMSGRSEDKCVETDSEPVVSSEEGQVLDINLRFSCLACRFISDCPVMDDCASPDCDVLIGTYAISALKTRCII